VLGAEGANAGAFLASEALARGTNVPDANASLAKRDKGKYLELRFNHFHISEA